MAAILKLPLNGPLWGFGNGTIFLSTLKTVIMPIFLLLTESEQFKHISALLQSKQLQKYGDNEQG